MRPKIQGMENKIITLVNRRWFRRCLMVVIGMASVVLIAFFGLRNGLLRHFADPRLEAFNKRFGAELTIGDLFFTGWATLQADSVMLRPAGGDTLLTLGRVRIRPSLLKLILGRLSPAEIAIERMNLSLVRQDTLTNYMFLLTSGRSRYDTSSPALSGGYAELTDRLAGLLFEKLPANLNVTGFRVAANLNGNCFVVSAPTFQLSDHETDNLVYVTNQSVTVPLAVRGRFDRSHREAGFAVVRADTTQLILPYLDWKWNARVNFDTLRFTLAVHPIENQRVVLQGNGLFAGLSIEQPMLSDKVVVFDRLEGDFVYRIGQDAIELDSASIFRINKLEIKPWIRVEPRKPVKVALELHKPWFEASDLFESLPPGLFANLQGMKVKGQLRYDLSFSLDMACPDSLRFFSNLDRRDFSIRHYGATNLTLLNGSFLHTAYEHGQPARSFLVGPVNPSFRDLESISPYLRHAIMTAEDGGFMWHRGFLPDAFRGAIIDNIKAGRFVRGGSTISMQLVKNVFLNRNKTVTRKLEEALIVWLIENQRLCSKERMLEVYLNVIEMGPLVYGVGEGAKFYFNKDASKLTLAESIFMASIVPHPKWFRYSFDERGHLRDFLAPYYSFLANRMVGKGFITEAEAATLQPDVKLTGPALQYLSGTDTLQPPTLVPDSLIIRAEGMDW